MGKDYEGKRGFNKIQGLPDLRQSGSTPPAQFAQKESEFVKKFFRDPDTLTEEGKEIIRKMLTGDPDGKTAEEFAINFTDLLKKKNCPTAVISNIRTSLGKLKSNLTPLVLREFKAGLNLIKARQGDKGGQEIFSIISHMIDILCEDVEKIKERYSRFSYFFRLFLCYIVK